MKRDARRMVMLSVTLALIGLLVISTAAFANGPDGAAQTRTQARTGDAMQIQLQSRTQSHDRLQDGTCMSCGAAGSQAQNGTQAQNGSGYGPGDGTGPIVGGSFGPGPQGQCIDLNGNGVCDCQE